MHKNMLSRKAACNSHGQDSSYFLGWEEYEKNPYDPITNPSGIIQMGLAENQLSFDLIEWWLESHPNPAGFKRDGTASMFRELALFQDYRGFPAFKKALANYMGYLRGNKVRFESNNLVLTAGATSANEILMFCLAEPGEAFLLPTPYYPGFDRDLKWRTGVEIVPIQCSSSNGFQITKAALEEAYKRAEKRHLGVKGVLITNPSNPLGTTTTRHELDTLLDFVVAKDIHLISDEIYSGTNFGSPQFISVAEAMIGRDDVSHRVHIVYSLSKDLGLPGFRVGAIYSRNDDVVAAATKMSSFGLISSHTQYLLSELLSDEEFTRRYTEENKRRIEERHRQLVEGLRNAGISCLRSNAGLYCWVDMRHLLESKTSEGEMELWKKMVYEVGLNISPGSSCHCDEHGWFRVCFANMPADTLDVAIRRLKTFVDSGHRGRDQGWRLRGLGLCPSHEGRIPVPSNESTVQRSLGDMRRQKNIRVWSALRFVHCKLMLINHSHVGYGLSLWYKRIIDFLSRFGSRGVSFEALRTLLFICLYGSQIYHCTIKRWFHMKEDKFLFLHSVPNNAIDEQVNPAVIIGSQIGMIRFTGSNS